MDVTTPVGEIEFVAFDFETTGLNPAVDRIVELGAVRFQRGAIIAEFNELVNPGISIGADSARITGITDAMVADKPPVTDGLKRFTRFLGQAVLMAHNATFDLGFLRAALQSAGMSGVDNQVIDTQLLAMKAFPRQKSYALQNLADELKLPRKNAHRATDDAELCMRLFLASVDALSFMGDLELGEVLTAPQS